MNILDLKHHLHRFKSLIDRTTSWDGFGWVIAITGVLGIGTLLSWAFWEDLHSEQESLSTTIRNLGLVIGGIIAMLLAVWRSQVATRQADTAQQGLLNERYQQGAEMLGSEVLSVRLGGIYALERLAQEHTEEYHIQIMNLLCAFVRHPTKDESLTVKQPPRYSLREDVREVVTTIGRRREAGLAIEKRESYRLDLRGADLSGLILFRSNLAKADLREANLVPTVFNEVDLSGSVFLGAVLSRPRPQCEPPSVESNHKATRPRASFYRANVSGALFSRSGQFPVEGMVQEHMDYACADPNNPPKLHGVLDTVTSEQLVWRGEPCGGGD